MFFTVCNVPEVLTLNMGAGKGAIFFQSELAVWRAKDSLKIDSYINSNYARIKPIRIVVVFEGLSYSRSFSCFFLSTQTLNSRIYAPPGSF